MSSHNAKRMHASHELEAMIPHLKEIVLELREDKVDAYATLYEARKRLSKIVASLGTGSPSGNTITHKWML